MSVSLVQSKSNHSISGASVSATFASNIAAGHGLLAAVTWIDPNNNAAAYPGITVADAFGAWTLKSQGSVPLGGDICTAIFLVPYCKAGPNGAVTATATAPGLMFISIHEIAPNAGEIFKPDVIHLVSGGYWDIGWDSIFSTGGSNHIQTNNAIFNDVEYALLVFATRSGNINPTASGWTNREYEANTTPIGTIGGGVLGSQATLEAIANVYASPFSADVIWSYPSSIALAIILSIASVPAIADSPDGLFGGEYPTHKTVTLAQDQGLEIHYTLDGTTPTSSSPLYTSPFAINVPTTVKAIAVQGSTAGWPLGFWADSPVVTALYDIYTGVCLNPNNIIDGDDSTFATLTSVGSPGDVVAAKVDMMNGTTGGPGNIKVDFEVTQNDLVAPSQTLPAWKVSAFIGGTEHVLASAAPGGGGVARNTVSQAVSAGVSASTLAAKISAICQIPGSTGGVQLKVYAAYLQEP